ncbi:MAG: manganese-binding transcriptional regulator MntR [Opitutaceae bacterium]|nr:manganese-binding transcriptional regulator MntR [Opitutaceae bacterium]
MATFLVCLVNSFHALFPNVEKRAHTYKKTIRPSALQAESLQQTRREHAAETAEDYVEAIADLSASLGEARVVDLARRLGVTHVTVNHTLVRLQRDGYIRVQPYRAIYLTAIGKKLAKKCQHRHSIVVAFLRSLGIPHRTAEIDAEGIEHHVSPATLAAFARKLKGTTL